MEAQINSISSVFWSPGAINTKLVAQVAYGLGFGHCTYAWNANKKTFGVVLIGGPNSFGVIKNNQNKLIFRIYIGVATSYFGLWAMCQDGRIEFYKCLS
jgi:hypothetical protein